MNLYTIGSFSTRNTKQYVKISGLLKSRMGGSREWLEKTLRNLGILYTTASDTFIRLSREGKEIVLIQEHNCRETLISSLGELVNLYKYRSSLMCLFVLAYDDGFLVLKDFLDNEENNRNFRLVLSGIGLDEVSVEIINGNFALIDMYPEIRKQFQVINFSALLYLLRYKTILINAIECLPSIKEMGYFEDSSKLLVSVSIFNLIDSITKFSLGSINEGKYMIDDVLNGNGSDWVSSFFMSLFFYIMFYIGSYTTNDDMTGPREFVINREIKDFILNDFCTFMAGHLRRNEKFLSVDKVLRGRFADELILSTAYILHTVETFKEGFKQLMIVEKEI